LPDGTRLPDRSPALLLHRSSRSGSAGFRDVVPTQPGSAPAHRYRVFLAGQTRLVCCMPNRPIQAAPETTTAPAQTTGRLVLLADSPLKAAARALYLPAASPRRIPPTPRSWAPRTKPAPAFLPSTNCEPARLLAWPTRNLPPIRRNHRESRSALDAAPLPRFRSVSLPLAFAGSHRLFPPPFPQVPAAPSGPPSHWPSAASSPAPLMLTVPCNPEGAA